MDCSCFQMSKMVYLLSVPIKHRKIVQSKQHLKLQLFVYQAQYVFVHNALLLAFEIGDTVIPTAQFLSKNTQFQTKDPTSGKSALEKQFQVLFTSLVPDTCSGATNEIKNLFNSVICNCIS